MGGTLALSTDLFMFYYFQQQSLKWLTHTSIYPYTWRQNAEAYKSTEFQSKSMWYYFRTYISTKSANILNIYIML